MPAPSAPTPSPAVTSAPLILEVRRGRTRYRCRPVWGERFLIGSDRHCDLRLGGHGFPPLHSIIVREGRTAWIDAIGHEPALMVNGRPCESTSLADGDRLVIGPFEFVVHFSPQVEHAAAVDNGVESQRNHEATLPVGQAGRPAAESSSVEVGSLSAAELVDELERDMELVEGFEEGRRLGARALAQRLTEMNVPATAAPSQPPPQPLAEDVSSVVDAPAPGEGPAVSPPVRLSTTPLPHQEPHDVLDALDELVAILKSLCEERDSLHPHPSAGAVPEGAASCLPMDARNRLAHRLELLEAKTAELRTLLEGPGSVEPTLTTRRSA